MTGARQSFRVVNRYHAENRVETDAVIGGDGAQACGGETLTRREFTLGLGCLSAALENLQ